MVTNTKLSDKKSKSIISPWLAAAVLGAAIAGVSCGPSEPPADQRIEAENASLDGTHTIDTDPGGFSGEGFVNYRDEGSIIWEVTISLTGTYELVFGYAIHDGDERPLRLFVDDVEVEEANLDFKGAGISTWTEESHKLTLDEGVRNIRVTSTGSSGANIDYLDIKYVDDE